MHRQNLSRNRQTLYFALCLFGLLGAFFVLLYFHFLPNNRNRIHRDAFNILRSNAEYIRLETKQFNDLYSSYINVVSKKNSASAHLEDSINKEIRKNNLSDTVSLKVATGTNSIADGNDNLESGSTNTTGFDFEKIAGNSTFQFHYPIDSLLRRIEADQHNEFVTKYMLVTEKELLYKSAALSISRNFKIDSLVKGEYRYVSGTFLLSVDDEMNRVFFFPFSIRGLNLYICGLVPEKVYKSELFRLNNSFVYIMITFLVLLIITQPILKLVLMGRHETVRFSGFVFFIIAVFVGTTAITLLTLHILMLTGSSVRSEKNLAYLGRQMENSFALEVNESLELLDTVDYIMNSTNIEGELPDSLKKEIDTIVSRRKNRGHSTRVDRLFWIDSLGMQVLKVEFEEKGVGRINVKDRSYFQLASTGRLSGQQYIRDGFAMEAVRNRINGAFRIVLSKPSIWKNYISAVSVDMRTWHQPLLPGGYGFCLIDENGIVQAHEKDSKNLKENLLDRLPDPGLIKQSIKGRTAVFRTDVQLYGYNTDVYFYPLKGMPYFLVLYYNKNFDTTVALKIVSFTLIHVTFIYLLYIIAWFLYFGRRIGGHHRLFAPIHQIGWAIPSYRMWPFYLKGSLILFTGVAGAILIMITSPHLDHGNTLIFMMIMLSPLGIVSALALIYAKERKLRNVVRWMKPSIFSSRSLLISNLLIQLFILLMSILVLKSALPELCWSVGLQAVQWILIAWPLNKMPQSGRLPRILPDADRRAAITQRHRFLYFIYMFLLVLSIAIIPATALTWMAHNIELEQQVKKQELHLASRLLDRQRANKNYLPLVFRQEQSGQQQQAHMPGIFSPTGFSLAPFQGHCPPIHPEITDDYYYRSSQHVAARSYDPLFFPSLPDDPSDGQWHFKRESDSITIFYSSLYANPVPGSATTGIRIKMATGPRFVYFEWSLKGVLLWIFVATVLALLAKTLRYGISSFFLWKYLDTARRRNAVAGKSTYWKETASFDAFLNISIPAYKKDSIETVVMKAVDNSRSYFEYIWDDCSDKEKFILIDFAHDGLLNYKNNYEITKLIEKGILVPHKRLDIFRLFSASFRLFLLTKKHSSKMTAIAQKYNRASTMGSFRFILMAVAIAFFTFIFFTQNAIFEKILALSGSIVAVLANFSRITGTSADKSNGA